MDKLFPEVGVAQIIKYSEELCGDKVLVEKTAEGTIVVLSDGLGSGVKANILATLTTKIITVMLKHGSPLEDVIDTIAQTLPVCKQRNIAYSTFHIVNIAKSGETYVVEFDSPPTLLYRNGKVIRFPVQEKEISGKKLNIGRLELVYDDSIIMVSDGVLHAGIGGLLKLGWGLSGLKEYVQENYRLEKTSGFFSREIVNCCEGYYLGKAGDDTTAVVVKMRQTKKLVLFTGPPTDQKLDQILVKKLMTFDGEKIVAGGTTANIVSRYLGKPIKVELSNLNSEVPPIGYIEGIDLVTEGVLTINSAVERLRSGIKQGKKNFSDGADKLMHLLLEADDILVLAGKAVNPAHQNPNFPIQINLKMQVVEKLINALREAGKSVKVEWF